MLLARNASDAWGTPLISISGAKVDIIDGLTKDLMIKTLFFVIFVGSLKRFFYICAQKQ
jgi:hypothetical protein